MFATRTLPIAAAFVLWAGAAAADRFTDQLVARFKEMGFTFIEVQEGIDQVKIEGVRGTRQLEIIYDRSTGRILKQEQERADADDIGRSGVRIRQRNRNFVQTTFSPPSDTAIDTEKVISDLRAAGYDFIEVKRGPTQTKVEATRGGQQLEIVYDNATGRVLKRETGLADSDDVGRTGLEIDSEDRDFIGDRRRASRDDDDRSGRRSDRDDDDDDSGRGSHDDDDDDDDDNSGRRSHDDDDDDDDDNSGHGSHDDDDDDD